LEIEKNKISENDFKLDVNKPFVVVGIPAFNEELTIARIVLRAQNVVDKVVVCDDGSKDLTAKIAKKMGAEVIKHKKNLGYGAALESLFLRGRELNADILVTLDGDGQHDPHEIPDVIKPIVNGSADVVIGSRFIEDNGKNMPFHRRFGTKVITRLTVGSSKNGVGDAQSGFRAYSQEALKRLFFVEKGMGASVELLKEARRKDLKICEVSCSCKYDNGDVSTSTHHPMKHGAGVILSLIRCIIDEKPLQLLGIPGFMFLMVAAVFSVWLLQIYAIESVIETNIALASLSFAIIGFFMLSSGITLYAISRLSKRINGKK